MTDATSSKQEKTLNYIAVEQSKTIITRKQGAAGLAPWLDKRYYWKVVAGSDLDLFIRADSAFAQWRAYGLNKEPHFFDWIGYHIKAGEVVWDVGANVGVMSMAIAKLKRGDVEVHAFEPVPSSFGQMMENCVFNALKDIRAWCFALSNQTGPFLMNLDTYEAGGSLHDFMQEDHRIKNPLWAMGMRGDQMADLGIPDPHHVKIDVDGVELLVLEGMQRLLAGSRLRTVLIEVDRKHLDAADAVFVENGFQKENEWEHPKADGSPWDAKDILYVRSKPNE